MPVILRSSPTTPLWSRHLNVTAASGTLGVIAVLLTPGANAQSPLVPLRVAVSHHHAIVAPPQRDLSPRILSGVSFVSVPRPGSAATRTLFSPLFEQSAQSSVSGWTSIGPDSVLNAGGTVGGNADAVSGRVAAIAVDPTDNNTVYVAAAGGGVWKTTDGGSSYLPLTDFLGDTAMGSITVAPSNSNIIYAGTGEANNSGDSQYGIGLLKSTDAGATWSLIPGPSGAFYQRAISKIVVSPANSSLLYLTITDFAENGQGGNTGVWKSTDGGTTWANVTAAAGLDSYSPYSDLVMDPTHPTTLYAAIGDLFGSSTNGVYKTTDGGTTWTLLTGGFPTTSVGRISLALAASAPGTLYASVASSSNYGLLGLYKTINGGTTWTQQTAAPNYLGGQGWYDNAIAVSPTNPNAVFAGGQVNYSGSYGSYYALAGSLDGGSIFQDYSIGSGYVGPHTDLHALTFTPDGTKLLDGNDGGMWRLENPGAAGGVNTTQWSDINANLDTIQFTGIALHPTDATIAYGGSQDNGTEKYSGTTAWSQVRSGDGGFTRVDQSNPQTVYHEYYGISLERSDDGGMTWNGTTSGINPNDPQPADGSDPAAFYVPYKLDPLNQSRVIYGTDHVYESLDRGDSFSIIGTPGTANYNPSDGILTTLGVAGNTIYAATGTSLFATVNDGTLWTDVSIPGFSGRTSDIWVNPANAHEVYVSRSSFGAGKIYHSTNGGSSWTDISGNLPDEPFNAIVSDTAMSMLYAGGDDGVYASSNAGASWSRLDPTGNFPTVQVVDLAISPGANVIGAGTHGRGMFEIARTQTVAAPTNLTATAGPGKVSLAWTAPAGVSGAKYNLYRGTASGAETLYYSNVPTTSFVNTNVTAGTKYYYTVKTVVGSQTSVASNEASATPTATTGVPAAPTNLKAVAGDTKVTLTWTAPTGTVTSYSVYRGTSATTLTFYKTAGTATSFVNTYVVNGTTYYYAVAAVNSAGTGPQSSVVSATPLAVPSAPTNLTATASGGKVTLNWSASKGTVSSYSVYRGTASGGETFYKTANTSTTFVNTYVTKGTTYYYTIKALNASGTSAASNEASATP